MVKWCVCMMALLMSAGSAQAQSFSDGFESGLSAWTAWRSDNAPGKQPPVVSAGCHVGSCVRFDLRGGAPQQSVLVERSLQLGGPALYASFWLRFPLGYSWDPAPGYTGTEHKLLLVSVADGVGRILLNLRGGGATPELAVFFEQLENSGGVNVRGPATWPADGLWHQLELVVGRTSSATDRVQLRLDGRTVIDTTGRTCGSPCAPVVGVQVGAFVNQGARVAQSFYLDDVVIGDAGSPPPPPPPPDRTAAALDAIARAAAELQRAVDALEGR